MGESLRLSSAAWEEEQARKRLQGHGGAYRVVAAWRGDAMEMLFDEICCRLSEPPKALPRDAHTFASRALAFRAFSRAACCAHSLLRKPRAGYPYKLFSALTQQDSEADAFAAVEADPECLYDALTEQFLKHFRPLDTAARRKQAQSLEVLAACVDLDIATVECKHASVRRTTHQCSVQTWLSRLEDVNVDWIARQLSLISSKGVQTRQEAVHETAAKQNTAAARPKGKCSGHSGGGGGGGAYRAYMSMHHTGGRFKAQNNQNYRALPPAEKAFYEAMGARGTMAWRQGHNSFGPRLPREAPVEALPGSMTASGSVVLAAAGPSELVAVSACSFEEDLQKIRVKFLKQSKRIALCERAEMRQSVQKEIALMEDLQLQLLSAVPASQTFGAACSPVVAGTVQLTWLPPCEEFAKAALSQDNKSAKKLSLGQTLVEAWSQRSRVIRHEEQQVLVQALVALQPLVHNVLLNPLILPVESHLAREAKAAKERKEASPPRAKRKEASPPEAMENAD
ncbi:hypothetical protein AK812_SmicGene45543 [Symbiodinium microadriaticum]|uniref:Uncharacterized protein n=1 Tax=Symbiodinium microadriaticum TaxID=2951 RepID=A0A1Q9BVX9_SYMMI|nr:hypothetical protein AK812_SmicGene45543 [Symbiodinium microadriaticum]